MKDIKTIGILVNRRWERLPVLKLYRRYQANRGIRLVCFAACDIDWGRKRVRGLHYQMNKWQIGFFPFPTVIYNRYYTSSTEVMDRLGQVIGSTKCFNQANQFDKLQAYQHTNPMLHAHLPETLAYQAEALEPMLVLHKRIYLKPARGSQGRGVYRIEAMESGDYHLSNHYVLPFIITRSIGELQSEVARVTGALPYLIQKGIDTQQLNNRTFDIRVLVQKNSSGQWSYSNAISRIAYEGCFNTSICERVETTEQVLNQLYSPDVVFLKMSLISWLGVRTAELTESELGVHLGEISVDMTLDQEGNVWIIEVNGMPQKSLYSDQASRQMVYSRPLEYGAYLCNS
ncbi:YheC/YheD family protein [Gorillibacterium sp. CAU 1737]|uniref:YheC/YheD family endospore coat-associated protein n=1 Tax=Gorillibacterium sp. CAU 1737 TaxID=3140362 RepID=UPI003261B729